MQANLLCRRGQFLETCISRVIMSKGSGMFSNKRPRQSPTFGSIQACETRPGSSGMNVPETIASGVLTTVAFWAMTQYPKSNSVPPCMSSHAIIFQTLLAAYA